MKEYSLSAPLINFLVTEKTRDEYLKQLKSAEINRVLLCLSDFGNSQDNSLENSELLSENIRFFEKNGIEAAVWIGLSIGHGAALVGAEKRKYSAPFLPLVNVKGQVIENTRCPLDPNFRSAFSKYVADVARAGAKIIFLDDDFRLSQHGTEFCCACEKHMEAICKLLGEKITREELDKLAFGEKANKYRLAWLTAQNNSMLELSREIRREVDKVDPAVTVGLCTPHCLWDIDGTSPIELAQILAGDNKPLIRLHSAPYSATHSSKSLTLVFELARMFASFADGCGAELYAEGDVYPRPRYFTPSSHLELYDAVIRANGVHDGMFKYIFDYVSEPLYETGYLERHCRMLPLEREIGELFEGKVQCGVSVPIRPGLLRDADLSIGVKSQLYPYPWAGAFLSVNSIPTVYKVDGICTAVFGEEARHIEEERINKGAVLDAVSALILSERGIDVGLRTMLSLEYGAVNELLDLKSLTRVSVWKGDCRIMKAELSNNVSVLIEAVFNGESVPLAYCYENEDGQRFLVYLFDSMAFSTNPNLLRGYLGQKILIDYIEWISKEKLPATSVKNPELYIMTSRKESDGTLAVALFNCYPDSILEPVIKLDSEYRNIRFINCEGRLDGDTVTLLKPLGAFEMCAFEVFK